VSVGGDVGQHIGGPLPFIGDTCLTLIVARHVPLMSHQKVATNT
jgi:hypothetical protein